MNVRGGYKLVDFGDVNIVTATPTNIAGIYEQLENNYHKPLIFTNMVLDGALVNDFSAKPVVSGGAYVVTLINTATATNVNATEIKVESNDTVTVTAIEVAIS